MLDKCSNIADHLYVRFGSLVCVMARDPEFRRRVAKSITGRLARLAANWSTVPGSIAMAVEGSTST